MSFSKTFSADVNSQTTGHTSSASPIFLNIGCGASFHPDWVNIDFTSTHPSIIGYDLHMGIPFADESFELVYHSHFLEYFSQEDATFLLQECYRVLKPHGLLRVVVPDLEDICEAYLHALAEAKDGGKEAKERHRWMSIELLDQMTRSKSGGAMLAYWKQKPLPQSDFLFERSGNELSRALASIEALPHSLEEEASMFPPDKAVFLESGELHKWMYDSVLLGQSLEDVGFLGITIQQYDTSSDTNFLLYELDVDNRKRVRKPHSLIMEARKPQEIQRSPRVVLFSSSDNGGAGIAACRLHKALRQNENISELYVASQHARIPGVHILPTKGHNPVIKVTPYNAQHVSYLSFEHSIQKALRPYGERPAGLEYFSMPNTCGDFSQVIDISKYDIIHLHWIAGMCDPALDVQNLKGLPVVWTLHDMNPFTGGCHYSGECNHFELYCGACPQLASRKENDLSRQTWKARMEAYRQLDLHIVCPSEWLAQQARKSTLFSRFPVHHIPNVHPYDVFKPLQRKIIRKHMGISENALVFLFTSQHLGNERKGGKYLTHIVRELEKMPYAERCIILVLGNKTAHDFLQTSIRTEYMGHVNNEEHLSLIYNAADMALVPSLEDNQPNVICEAMGCGTPVVAFAAGGIPEMIKHRKNGYLALVGDAKDLWQGVLWAIESASPQLRTHCRLNALEHWGQPTILSKYTKLYSELLKK